MTSSLPSMEKLKGRENYNTWQFAMKTYLEHEELWECVTGVTVDTKLLSKAKSKIILMIDPVNYIHIQSAKTAKEVWDKLKNTFEDSGLTRRVSLLRQLITTKLEDCESVEVYVNAIMTTAYKLTGNGFAISEEWIGTILLAGLSDEYRPMIMGLESSGVAITGDSIKTKILQDVKIKNSEEGENVNACYGNYSKNFTYGKSSSKGPRCFDCNIYGHISRFCPNKNKSERTYDEKCKSLNLLHCGLKSGEPKIKNDWYIDSGASAHMTSRGDWLKNVSKSSRNDIVLLSYLFVLVKKFKWWK